MAGTTISSLMKATWLNIVLREVPEDISPMKLLVLPRLHNPLALQPRLHDARLRDTRRKRIRRKRHGYLMVKKLYMISRMAARDSAGGAI